MAKWLLIDGFNMAFRSYYAVPELTRKDGFPTGAIHGWVRTMWKLEDMEKPDHVAIFFDLGGSTERLALLPSYKAHRTAMPEPLQQQIPYLKELTRALGYTLIEENGIEADDLVGAAAKEIAKKGDFVYIVSSDKDFAQCLTSNIEQLLPPPTANPKLGWRKLDVAGVPKKFGVETHQIVDYLALIGDAADNIEGLPGVGPKTAQKWIQEYGSIENIIAKANYLTPARFQLIVPQYADKLRQNIQMIRLNTSHKVELDNGIQPNVDQLLAIIREMHMTTTEKEALKRYHLVSS